MANVLIVHGIFGSSKENWFPWLKRELEKLGHSVLVPDFPSPDKPRLKKWLAKLEEFPGFLDGNSIVVGHSLGVTFLLSVLEKQKAKAAFFVAGFAQSPGNAFDTEMKTFTEREFDWSSIRKNCGSFHIFHSDNDPYVPLEKAELIAENLGTSVIVVKGAGHFNAEAGYTEFGLLLEGIKKEI